MKKPSSHAVLLAIVLSVAILPASGTPALAAGCTGVDFRPKLGPVRNQDDIGWCYAFSAADLLNVHYNRTPARMSTNGQMTGTSFSAADIAVSFNLAKRQPLVTASGNIKTAVESAVSRGICQESVFRSQRAYNSAARVTEGSLKRELQEIRTGFARARGQPGSASCIAALANQVDDLFPRSSLPQLSGLVSNPRLTADEFMLKVRDQACGDRIFRSRATPQVRTFSSPTRERVAAVRSKLDAALDSGSPVGIAYDANKIREPWARSSDPAKHISAIVARAFRGGKCQYLIRNSWGPGCRGYSFGCEGGNIWVPADQLGLVNHMTWLTD